MAPPKVRGELSPRRKEDLSNQRQNLDNLLVQKTESVNGLRDLRRQIPVLAQDFQYEVEKTSRSVQQLIEENSTLQGQIICLEEEKKSQKLISKLEDEKLKKNEFELKELQGYHKQIDEEINDFIDRGDNLYQSIRQEIREQEENEQALVDEINSTANRSNILLRAKLNANKGDFERLRHLGQAKGAIGVELEQKVANSDKALFNVVATKKEAHKGLIDIRDVMKCDIGKDQKPYKADLSQVDQLCDLLNNKDQDLFRDLMPTNDSKEKEYLAN
mmetsp:Transcript_5439/g.8425  ORF Transcript_5439/g.8425 Transcript_5439/m.8425 type:complete len:274 (+) Transcript_5439:719-1540(+)